MKKIIFTYEGFKYTNIGDYIQSLAAKQYIDKENEINYYHRDKLNYIERDSYQAIMNGWFTHNKENWPPSSKLHPLFISFHINSEVYDSLLSEVSIKYLKKYAPIGCRDKATAEKLNKKGVDAYFSSCLTTTLGKKYSYSGNRKGIYIVDPVHYIPESGRKLQKYAFIFKYILYKRGIDKYIKSLLENNKYNINWEKDRLNVMSKSTRSYLLLKKIIGKKKLKEAEILTQFHLSEELPTNEERFSRAKELLEIYSKAELVITSRIHCALPCLGLETPVVFMQNLEDSEESTCRFDGLLDLLHIVKFKKDKVIESCLSLPLKISNIKNKTLYKQFATELKDKCENFFSEEK